MTHRRKPRPTASAGGAFLDFMAAFDPGVEHLVAERDRQERDLVVPGDSDPGWDVDLDAGVARLGAPPREDGTPEATHA